MESFILGVFVALLVNLPLLFRSWVGDRLPYSQLGLALCVGALLIFSFIPFNFLKNVRKRFGLTQFDGITELLVPMVSPNTTSSPSMWARVGFFSTVLALFSGIVGREGIGIEWGQAIRLRTKSLALRWFEQRKRTEVASILAASVTAVFRAPIAGVLCAVEFGMGGRISSITQASLGALLVAHLLDRMGIVGERLFFDPNLLQFEFGNLWSWLGLLSLLLLGFAVSTSILWVIALFRKVSIHPKWIDSREAICVGASIILLILSFSFRGANLPPLDSLARILQMKPNASFLGLMLFHEALVVALLSIAFGSSGILSIVCLMGGILGVFVTTIVSGAFAGNLPLSALLGVVCLWSGIFGTPLTAIFLAIEWTGVGSHIIPVALVAVCAQELRTRLGKNSWVEFGLESRGLALSGGKSVAILRTITVKSVMTEGVLFVSEDEKLMDVKARLDKFDFPLIPIVSRQLKFLGFITADLVDEFLKESEEPGQKNSIESELNARDLFHRYGIRSTPVRGDDTLAEANGHFNELPCAAVVGSRGELQGMLFAFQVRSAYDQELEKRSLLSANRTWGFVGR